MLCNKKCPRHTPCQPISNVVATDSSSFVCVGLHGEEKPNFPEDRFRHCFKSAGGTDTMHDYDSYDMKSVVSVFSEALLFEELENKD